MSTDMAQRCIPIKVKRPTRSGNWEEDTLRFVMENRQRLIGDLIGCLQNPAFPLERFSRWATWERAVLARLPDPSGAQAMIEERQGAADVEADEAGLIEEFFAGQLRGLGYDPENHRVLIPSATATHWLNLATHDNQKTIVAGRYLGQLSDEGRFSSIRRNKNNKWPRGVVWEGKNSAANATVYIDLENRISQRAKERADREGR